MNSVIQTLVDVAGPKRIPGQIENEHGRPGQEVTRLRREAEQGCPRAQRDLGLCYRYGLGVPEDKAEALRWLLRACAQGDGRAQFYAGQIYESRARTEADLVEAYMWQRVAADQGLPLGQAIFEALEQRMTDEEVYEAEQSARQIRPKAE
jgi:2-hydroxychromene-2-carboxylate isomerase